MTGYIRYESAAAREVLLDDDVVAWMLLEPTRIRYVDEDDVVLDVHDLAPGEIVAVPDGGLRCDAPSRPPGAFHYSLRADVPRGEVARVVLEGLTVHPGVKIHEPVTGLGYIGVRVDRHPNTDAVLELAWPSGSWRLPVPEFVRPEVAHGTEVRRGDVIANVFPGRARRRGFGSRQRLRELLEAHRPDERATVARVDGHIVAVDGRVVVVEDETGVRHQYLRDSRYAPPAVGETVAVGDAFENLCRDHRDLLELWGAERFIDHLAVELDEVFAGEVSDAHVRMLAHGVTRWMLRTAK